MTAAEGQPSEAHGHQHRDVSGGWLRPAVFGAMDGLVTNVSLIAGVGAGVSAANGTRQFIVLTGLPDLADKVATQLSAHPESALDLHVREELGVDPGELPSPYIAAAASLVTFAIGALIPLIPYLAGYDSLATALGLAAVAAFVGGGVVARLTDRPFLRGAVRQLLLGAGAASVTYLIGHLVGARV